MTVSATGAPASVVASAAVAGSTVTTTPGAGSAVPVKVLGVMFGKGSVSVGAAAASTLPFTGATHIQLMVVAAIAMLLAGALLLGLLRRHGSRPSSGGDAPTPS